MCFVDGNQRMRDREFGLRPGQVAMGAVGSAVDMRLRLRKESVWTCAQDVARFYLPPKLGCGHRRMTTARYDGRSRMRDGRR